MQEPAPLTDWPSFGLAELDCTLIDFKLALAGTLSHTGTRLGGKFRIAPRAPPAPPADQPPTPRRQMSVLSAGAKRARFPRPSLSPPHARSCARASRSDLLTPCPRVVLRTLLSARHASSRRRIRVQTPSRIPLQPPSPLTGAPVGGALSPLHEITISDPEMRKAAYIPLDAIFSAFAYPVHSDVADESGSGIRRLLDTLQGAALKKQKYAACEAFITTGGFVYFDSDCQLCGATALIKGNHLEFRGPISLRDHPAIRTLLERDFRLRPATAMEGSYRGGPIRSLCATAVDSVARLNPRNRSVAPPKPLYLIRPSYSSSRRSHPPHVPAWLIPVDAPFCPTAVGYCPTSNSVHIRLMGVSGPTALSRASTTRPTPTWIVRSRRRSRRSSQWFRSSAIGPASPAATIE